MINPSTDPLLSILLSGEHLQACLALLERLPLDNVNRPLPARFPYEIDETSNWSVLESFLESASVYSSNVPPATEPLYDVSVAPLPSQVAQKLVEMGAHVDAQGKKIHHHGDKEGTPWDMLTLAFDQGHFGFVEFLLEGPLQHLRATLSTRRTEREPYLHVLVRCQQLRLAKKFIQWGVSPNATDDWGRTALFCCKTPEAVQLLVEHGADASVQNSSKQSVTEVWNKELNAPQVKKMTAAMFASMSKTGAVDMDKATQQWFGDLLVGTKTTLLPHAKRLGITSSSAWTVPHLGISVTPLTWMLLNTSSRSSSRTAPLMEWALTGDQRAVFGKVGGRIVYNADVAFVCALMLTRNSANKGWEGASHSVIDHINGLNLNMSAQDTLQAVVQTVADTAVLLTDMVGAANKHVDGIKNIGLEVLAFVNDLENTSARAFCRRLTEYVPQATDNFPAVRLQLKTAVTSQLLGVFDSCAFSQGDCLMLPLLLPYALNGNPHPLMQALTKEIHLVAVSYNDTIGFNPYPQDRFGNVSANAKAFYDQMHDVMQAVADNPTWWDLLSERQWKECNNNAKRWSSSQNNALHIKLWAQVSQMVQQQNIHRHLRSESEQKSSPLKRKM